jgi:HSP20 family protein
MISKYFPWSPWTLAGLWETGSENVNLIDADTEYIIEVLAPGHARSDFKITWDSGYLKIQAKATESSEKENYVSQEFKAGPEVNLKIRVPGNGNGIEAEATDGVLRITVPKENRVIEIK